MKARPALLPNIFLLITVISWAFNFIAVKEAYREMTPEQVAVLRTVLMWGILTLICVATKTSLKMQAGDFWKFAWLGFTSLGVYIVLFLSGMKESSPTTGSIILQMSPIIVPIVAALKRQETWNSKAMIGAIAAFIGTALVIYGGSASSSGNSLLSNMTVLLAATLWGYSVVIMKPMLERYSPLQVLTHSMGGAILPILAYGLPSTLHLNFAKVSPYAWLMFFHISVISGVVGFLCFYQGVRQVGSSGASIYQFLVPPTTILLEIFFLHRAPAVMQLVGLVVVLAGVAYASRQRFLAQANAA